MTFDDDIEDKLDAFLDEGFEPAAWMQSTDRVIDAYKGEVESLRVEVQLLKEHYLSLQDSINTLKELHKTLNQLLESDQ